MKTNLKIVEASAGTGKTFYLSNRAIKILSEHDREIVALTFTKKAAAEIEQRVISRISDAILSSEKAIELSKFIGNKNDNFELILQSILNDSSFIVNTIDGFFHKIAKNFSDQLQLPNNWRLVDQNQIQEIYTDAIIDLFNNEDLSSINQLLQLLDQNSIHKSIFFKVLFIVKKLIETYSLSKDTDWSIQYREDLVVDYKKVLGKIKKLEAPKNKNGSIDKIWLKNINNSIESFSSKQWDNYLGTGLVKAIIEHKEKFSRKVIPEDFISNYNELNSFALNELLKQFNAKALSLRKIVEVFWKHYQRNKYSKSIVTFSDILISLSKNDIDYEDILLSLDNKVRHLLIDEFQDTSATQWKILKRHIDEICGDSEKSCLLVGDVKQAIYGWRGGESKIFAHTKSLYQDLEAETLDSSYRSSKAIINNVNDIFSKIDTIECLHDYLETAKQWRANYREHKSNISSKGEVNYYDETDYKAIANIINDNPDSSLGILVQTNDKVEEVIDNLSQYNVKIAQEGGASLYKSPAVKILSACLRILDNPSNTYEHYIVSCTNLLEQWGINLEQDNDKQSLEISSFLYKIYYEYGFHYLINFLVEELKKQCSNSDFLRLEKIKDLAFTFESNFLDEFCSLIKETKFSAPNEMQHKVMTIHQSKGLEFDIVILLELNTNIIDSKSSIIKIRGDEFGKIEKTIPFPNKNIRAASKEITEFYFQHQSKQVEQHLCNLYVALTRAKNELHIFLNDFKSLSLNKILTDYREL